MSKAFTREEDTADSDIVRRTDIAAIVHLTRAGIDRLRNEIADLDKRRALFSAGSDEAIAADRKARELELRLANAVVVETRPEDGVVRFGATVTVRSERDADETTYRIVAPAEANASAGAVSSLSPLAQALLNRKVGDRVLFKYPAGEDTLEILNVSYEEIA